MPTDFDGVGHEEGAQAPFPPVWEADPFAGHHKSCGARVKVGCTCGYLDWLITQATKDKALMALAGEYLHGVLNLPADVHIVGATWESVGNSGNVILALQAFDSDEFPSPRVTARFHEKWDLTSAKYVSVFDGWEPVD